MKCCRDEHAIYAMQNFSRMAMSEIGCVCGYPAGVAATGSRCLRLLAFFYLCDIYDVFRLHRTHAVRRCSLLLQMSTAVSVCPSVSLSVCWSNECVVQKTAEPIEMSYGVDLCGFKEPCIRWGSRFPTGGTILGLSGPLKSNESLCCGCSKIIQSSITAWQRDCCSRLQCSRIPTRRCHISLSPVKNRPPLLWPFVNILWPLVYFVNLFHLKKSLAK